MISHKTGAVDESAALLNEDILHFLFATAPPWKLRRKCAFGRLGLLPEPSSQDIEIGGQGVRPSLPFLDSRQAWYRPNSRRTMRRMTAKGRNASALEMARRIPALAFPSGSRFLKAEARSKSSKRRTTAPLRYRP